MEPVTVDKLLPLTLLREMPDQAKANVARVLLEVSEEFDLEDGEALMKEDYMAFDSGYVLVQGTVEIEKEGRQLSEVTAPAVLGEMSQFKAGDTRTATVRAKGAGVALYFRWEDFNARAKEMLSEAERRMLRDGIERLVWDRFACQGLLDLPLFRGMSEQLRHKVCIIFPWIVEPANYAPEDIVFREGEHCQSTGYLVTKGALKLAKSRGTEKRFEAPNLVGIMPKYEPGLTWRATAIAQNNVEAFTFSWKTYTGKLQERLTAEEQRQMVDSMKQNASEHFWH